MAYLKIRSSKHSLTTFPTGNILQVVSKSITDSDTIAGEDGSPGVIIDDFSLAITPADANNKIYLMATMNVGQTAGGERLYFKFNGGNSGVQGDAATGHECFAVWSMSVGGGSQDMVVMSYLDAPATASAITYSVYWWLQQSSSGTGYINRSGGGDAWGGNAVSTLTAMEVAV